ncbi:hypothetical protein O7632_11825 [Solwaraspora sp. WMMD406]|nr:hypothetical protein [Solwaraspora sp. WMMD406]MDG4764788.1 hypothetical protein [Solwaraspora sp. WMMD406]
MTGIPDLTVTAGVRGAAGRTAGRRRIALRVFGRYGYLPRQWPNRQT